MRCAKVTLEVVEVVFRVGKVTKFQWMKTGEGTSLQCISSLKRTTAVEMSFGNNI